MARTVQGGKKKETSSKVAAKKLAQAKVRDGQRNSYIQYNSNKSVL